MDASAILQPVFVVATLSVVMTIWMVTTRVPAMIRLGIDVQELVKVRKFGEFGGFGRKLLRI